MRFSFFKDHFFTLENSWIGLFKHFTELKGGEGLHQMLIVDLLEVIIIFIMVARAETILSIVLFKISHVINKLLGFFMSQFILLRWNFDINYIFSYKKSICI